MIGVMVIFQTGFQLQAGVNLTPGQIGGYAGSFVLLAAFATRLLARFYRRLVKCVQL